MNASTAQRKKAKFFAAVDIAKGMARLLENQHDLLFFVKNNRYEIVAANQHFIERMGMTHEHQLIGKTAYDLAPPELVHMYHEDDEMVMRTGNDLKNRVEVIVTDDGITNWFVTTKVPLYDKDGKIAGIAALAKSITKATRALSVYAAFQGVVDYAHEHYAEKLTVADLAKVAHMSIRSFERRFKRTFGKTPIQYIIRYRVHRACELLRKADWGFATLAQEVGFYDQSAFTRAFVKIVGMRPKDYRKTL